MAKSLAVARPTAVLPTMIKSTISKWSLHLSFLDSDDLIRRRINRGQVRALVQVAALAGQTEIF